MLAIRYFAPAKAKPERHGQAVRVKKEAQVQTYQLSTAAWGLWAAQPANTRAFLL
jgi:hypothetical protein